MEILILLLGLKTSKKLMRNAIRPRRAIARYRKDLIFISKFIGELYKLIILIVISIFKSLKWIIRKAFRLNQNKVSVSSEDLAKVISLSDYKKKRVSGGN